MRLVASTLICLLILSVAFSGVNKQEGALTDRVLEKIEKSFQYDQPTRMALNAISSNSIRDLALNKELVDSLDHLFTNEIEVKGITDQESSGRCWLFSIMNMMRYDVIKKYELDDFELSQVYSFFWDKLEKANLFLEYVIESKDVDYNDRELVMMLNRPMPDGGFWIWAADVISKYGVVPKSVSPETFNTKNTRYMNSLVKSKLKIDAGILRDMAKEGAKVKKLRKEKIRMLSEIYRMLVINMGIPPKSFQWRYMDKDDSLHIENHTPQSFLKEVVGFDRTQYACICNCPTQEYGKLYQIKLARGAWDGTDWLFINLEMDKIKEYAYNSLMDTIPVEISVDMGHEMHSKKGYMFLDVYDYSAIYGGGIDFKFKKENGVMMRESLPNHSMMLVGVDTTGGKVNKWRIENSWGSDRGENGLFAMSDEWFDQYGYSLVITVKYLPDEVLEIMKQKPIELPGWDPLARVASLQWYFD